VQSSVVKASHDGLDNWIWIGLFRRALKSCQAVTGRHQQLLYSTLSYTAYLQPWSHARDNQFDCKYELVTDLSGPGSAIDPVCVCVCVCVCLCVRTITSELNIWHAGSSCRPRRSRS